MIGFVGSPWTLACYMLSGGVDKEYMPARVGAWSGAEDFVKLIDILVAACVHLASAHIKAGAEIIQLFDSWAGLLHGEAYVKYVIEANNRVVSKLKQLHPATPIIVFPRGSGIRYKQFAEQTLADGLGLDQNVDPAWAVENLPERLVLQGNLDPAILLTNPEIIAGEVKKMREHFQGRKYIANLGHGISQHTPINNVEAFITAIRK